MTHFYADLVITNSAKVRFLHPTEVWPFKGMKEGGGLVHRP